MPAGGRRRRLSAWRVVLTPLAEHRLKCGDARFRLAASGFRLAAGSGFQLAVILCSLPPLLFFRRRQQIAQVHDGGGYFAPRTSRRRRPHRRRRAAPRARRLVVSGAPRPSGVSAARMRYDLFLIMHDPGYKRLFAQPRMVQDLLHGFAARDWSDALDFSTSRWRSCWQRCSSDCGSWRPRS